jgi:hypothetical protein
LRSLNLNAARIDFRCENVSKGNLQQASRLAEIARVDGPVLPHPGRAAQFDEVQPALKSVLRAVAFQTAAEQPNPRRKFLKVESRARGVEERLRVAAHVESLQGDFALTAGGRGRGLAMHGKCGRQRESKLRAASPMARVWRRPHGL